ncbi:uncharacterized protein [Diadema setosum]|uniref:uncharacterized protein n=1 Tax=Diadema setosum TaxID=31175 RepID=UPI003B3AC63B
MAHTPDQHIVLQSSEGQNLLNGTSIRQTLLLRIFSKQLKSGYCGVHTAALLMSARLFGQKYPDERQHCDCDVSDVPFTDTNMFTFKETTRVVTDEVLVKQGATLMDIQELFHQHGIFKQCEIYLTSENNVDDFRSKALAALSHGDSSQGIMINFESNFIHGNKSYTYGHLSPLAAYHEASDRFLLLDTAVQKKEVWVSTEDIYRKMDTRDPTSGRKRGFLIAR